MKQEELKEQRNKKMIKFAGQIIEVKKLFPKEGKSKFIKISQMEEEQTIMSQEEAIAKFMPEIESNGTDFEKFTKIKARPLKISLLRPFMKKFAELAEVAEDNDKSTTILIECVQIAMKQYKPDIADDAKKLEENIDLPTVYRVIESASGVKLQDANALLNTVLANN